MIFKGPNFFVHYENEHFCLGEWGRKRLRLARARILVERGAGTLERLEMAAQKQDYHSRATRETSETERRRAERRFAVRRQTRACRDSAFFQSAARKQSG